MGVGGGGGVAGFWSFSIDVLCCIFLLYITCQCAVQDLYHYLERIDQLLYPLKFLL